MVSAVDRAKRALVTLLRLLATAYGFVADVTRESSDLEIKSAYRKLSRKVHPDKGGLVADQTRLNCAYEGWQNEVKRAPGRGKARGTQADTPDDAPGNLATPGEVNKKRQEYRINSDLCSTRLPVWFAVGEKIMKITLSKCLGCVCQFIHKAQSGT